MYIADPDNTDNRWYVHTYVPMYPTGTATGTSFGIIYEHRRIKYIKYI